MGDDDGVDDCGEVGLAGGGVAIGHALPHIPHESLDDHGIDLERSRRGTAGIIERFPGAIPRIAQAIDPLFEGRVGGIESALLDGLVDAAQAQLSLGDLASQGRNPLIGGCLPFVTPLLDPKQDFDNALGREELVEQSLRHQLLGERAGNAPVAAGGAAVGMMAPLLGCLDALVIAVDLPGPRRACRCRQRVGVLAVAPDESAEQRGGGIEAGSALGRLTRQEKRLHGLEGLRVNDLRHLIGDDLFRALAFPGFVGGVELALSDIGASRQDLVDGAGAEQGSASGSEAPLVQPHRDLLGAERTGGSISVPGQSEAEAHDLRFDRFDRQPLLLLVPDQLGIDRLVSEGNVPAVGISPAGILDHGPACIARGLVGLVFVNDTNELTQNGAGRVRGERLDLRDDLDAVLAEVLDRDFLVDRVAKGSRQAVDEDEIHGPRAVCDTLDHLLESWPAHRGRGLALIAIDSGNLPAFALAACNELIFLRSQAEIVARLSIGRYPHIDDRGFLALNDRV